MLSTYCDPFPPHSCTLEKGSKCFEFHINIVVSELDFFFVLKKKKRNKGYLGKRNHEKEMRLILGLVVSHSPHVDRGAVPRYEYCITKACYKFTEESESKQ